MANTPRTQQARKAKTAAKKTYKFEKFRAAAEKERAGAPPRVEIPPFVMDDVDPPIVITAPDTLERQLMLMEMLGPDGNSFNVALALPLLRVICGEAFPRVWTLIRNDPDARVVVPMIDAMLDHFQGAIADLQQAQKELKEEGGSEDSSA